MNNNDTSVSNNSTPATETTGAIDIFNLNDDAKYCYYYDAHHQQQQNTEESSQQLYYTQQQQQSDENCSLDFVIKKLVEKYEWLRFNKHQQDAISSSKLLVTTKHELGYADDLPDYLTFACHYCNNYLDRDKLLSEKFHEYLVQNEAYSSYADREMYYSLSQFLHYHQETSEHKTACASTYITHISPADTSSVPSSTSSSNNQQPDSTIIITNLDLNASSSSSLNSSCSNTLTPRSSPTTTTNPSQTFLVIDSSNRATSKLRHTTSSSSSCSFKDEEMDSCLNSHDLVVNDHLILQTLAQNTDQQQMENFDNYYNCDNSTAVINNSKQSKKRSRNSTNCADIHQYGSILKAINKRKLHISCPLCVSKVVNMSDHLVKKHNIKDRYQRKNLMDSVRRNYLAVNISSGDQNSCTASSTSSNGSSSFNSKRLSPTTSQLVQNLFRQSSLSTPSKTKKSIKCPICVDDNKYFVNISDHLIKIHHLNTSEMRKPVLKSIKGFSSKSNSCFSSSSNSSSCQQQQQQQNQHDVYDTAQLVMLIDEHEYDIDNSNVNKQKSSDEMVIISSNTAHENATSTDNGYLVDLNETFDENHDDEQDQHEVICSNMMMNHQKYQQIKKNDLRKSILKRYSKQIRKAKTQTNCYTNRNRRFLPESSLDGQHHQQSDEKTDELLLNDEQLLGTSKEQDACTTTTTTTTDDQAMFSLLKSESAVNHLDSAISLCQSNSTTGNNNDEYYSNSSIIINPQHSHPSGVAATSRLMYDDSEMNQERAFKKLLAIESKMYNTFDTLNSLRNQFDTCYQQFRSTLDEFQELKTHLCQNAKNSGSILLPATTATAPVTVQSSSNDCLSTNDCSTFSDSIVDLGYHSYHNFVLPQQQQLHSSISISNTGNNTQPLPQLYTNSSTIVQTSSIMFPPAVDSSFNTNERCYQSKPSRHQVSEYSSSKAEYMCGSTTKIVKEETH